MYTKEDIELHSFQLLDLLAQSTNKMLISLPVLDNVLFVQDNGSWRKHIEKPVDDIYKGNRTYPEEDIDWETVWRTNDRFVEGLRSNNITCVKDRDIEGDDWIAYWSKKLNAEGINTVIWSTDKDLQQLVSYDRDHDSWTAWYNSKSLILHKDLDNTNIDMVDFFFHFDEQNLVAKELIDNVRNINQDVQYIDPRYVVFSKILCGDQSDNIKAVIRMKKNNRTVNVTERDIKTLVEGMSMDEFFNSKGLIINELARLKKFQGADIDTSRVSEVFDYNTRLVWLDESVYPEDVVARMHAHAEDYTVTDIHYIKNNYKTLMGDYNDRLERDNIMDLYSTL